MGIAEELVIKPDDVKHFMCSICRDMVDNHVMIKLCDHIFCKECLDFWSVDNKCCPECRIKFTENDLGKSRLFDNLISDFVMKCSNENCEKIFSPKEFRSHLTTCDFGEFFCEFCFEKMVLGDSSLHLVRTKIKFLLIFEQYNFEQNFFIKNQAILSSLEVVSSD